MRPTTVVRKSLWRLHDRRRLCPRVHRHLLVADGRNHHLHDGAMNDHVPDASKMVVAIPPRTQRSVRCFGFHCTLRNDCQLYFGNAAYGPGNHVTTDFFPHSEDCVRFVRVR